jgi:hypothetical protein
MLTQLQRPSLVNLGMARHVAVWIFLVAIAFAGLFYDGTRQNKETLVQEQVVDVTVVDTTEPLIVQGLSGDVPYYHCAGKSVSGSSNDSHYNIVLLHGSRFTKEDWKTSGILQKLCLRKHVSVTALDLDVRSNHEILQQTLENLAANNLVTLPVSALVTPSASGFAVADWLQNGNSGGNDNGLQPLQNYVAAWIPVASPSISLIDDSHLAAIHTNGNMNTNPQTEMLRVLAIYGSRDAGGKAVSNRLKNLAHAVAVELDGGHPCYLDSPDAFIDTVLQFLFYS